MNNDIRVTSGGLDITYYLCFNYNYIIYNHIILLCFTVKLAKISLL